MKHIFQIIIISTGLLLGQTAEQIKQAKEVIQRTGMSESQAKDAAKAQGYTDKQIDTAIQKEKATKTELGKSVPESSEKIGLPELGKSNEVVQKQPVLETIVPIVGEELPIIGNDDLEIVGDGDLEVVDETELDIESEGQPARGALTYFGYDIFARDPALFQATSVGAVDPNYLIGPGDEIIVMLWGETQFRQVLTVDREGFVFIPEIGQVFVNGLNLNLLESKLFRVFSQSYASLNPQGRTPTTFLDVSLGNLRPLRIQVLGEVAQPGAYTVSPSASLFSALYYFNGPTTRGSLRDIQLIRGGKKIASIDFYDYLLTGKKPKDQKLQLDDVIFIPRRLKTVTIEGEINRSGIYELKPKESLTDLITMAGDLKITAYLDRAQIDRIVPFEDRAELGMDRMYTDVNLEQVLKSADVFPLQDGDRMQIFSVLDLRQNVVDLRGAVTRPGSYDLGDSLKLSELINKGDGLLGDAYLERIDVVRIKPDFTEELIKLDLGQVLDGNPDYDIYLRGLDRVRVYGMTEMVPRTYVSITGHAKRPGRFLLQENMTLYDLIFKAGGYVDEEYKKLTYLKRAELVRVSKESDEKEIIPFNLGLVLDKQGIANTALRTDDAIRIYSVNEIEGDTRYVSISGHVKRPGQYELFAGNMTLYDLIFKAGGFDDPLYKSQTFLSRADLIRFDNDRITQSIIPFNLDAVLSDKNNEQNIILLPGDEIRVYSEIVFNTVESVSINGIVRSPGTYNLKTGMTLKDLILEAGGLNANVYRYRAEVARIDPLNNNLDEYAEVITFNMDEKFSVSSASSNDGSKKEFSATSNGFQLNPYDLVSIRPDPYFSDQKQVTISGEVLYPGQYTILTSDEKITDIIERAGGLRPNAYPDASQYTRQGVKINASFSDIIKNPKSKLNFKVQNGDEIIMVPHPNVVRITGEVNTVGIHKYVSGKRLRYYLSLAGGLNPDADKRNIWVEYPNGDSKKFNY
ncbi:MAG: hypothetical protein HOA05_09535, partial [Candidatus Marinimicrobia bacterium]|nr:hypothetical protein [Candidatus Neomarinimicrobiota bacterium]